MLNTTIARENFFCGVKWTLSGSQDNITDWREVEVVPTCPSPLLPPLYDLGNAAKIESADLDRSQN